MNGPSRSILIAPESAYFAGHFPGDPLVPGAKLIELILEALSQAGVITGYPITVPVAKFLSPVRPGDELTLTWSAGRDAVRFECRAGGLPVVSGKVRSPLRTCP